MNHPHHEEWMSFLYDEVPPARRTDLQAHLSVCPDCKQAVEGWRLTLGQLDSWKLPAATLRARRFPLSFRWAAAAAAVLGAGFLFGRFSAPPTVDPTQLRAELKQEFSRQLQASLDSSRADTQQALESLASAWTQARRDDQQTTFSLLQRSETSRQADFAALRRDLETVALIGEQGFRSTRNQLARLSTPSTDTDYDILPATLNQERK